MRDTILWQRAEGAFVFIAALTIYLTLEGSTPMSAPLPIWGAALIFFAPDLSFAAYIFGPKLGARAYNLVHVYAVGAVLMAIGTLAALPLLTAIGLLMLAHTGFDRMLGYGLKSATGFKDTHLGAIGPKI
jgi:hypothetical protein